MKTVVAVTPPKSGSHALANALQLLPFAPWFQLNVRGGRSSFTDLMIALPTGPDRAWCHVPGEQPVRQSLFEEYRICLALKRDPLDIAVSWAAWLGLRGPGWKPLDDEYDHRWLSDLDERDRLEACIRLMPKVYSTYTPFYRDAGFTVIRYEDIVQNPWLAFKRLIRETPEIEVLRRTSWDMVTGARRRAYTFRRGLVGEYEEVFEKRHWRAAAESEIFRLRRDWGYK